MVSWTVTAPPSFESGERVFVVVVVVAGVFFAKGE
jgi:hypothetical protein